MVRLGQLGTKAALDIKMVSVKIYGGLGNQMFQYAAGLGLSARLRTSLVPDTGWFEEMKTNPYIISRREYELDIFGIKPRPVNFSEKVSLGINKPAVFREKSAGFQAEFENLSGNIILDGHWQSPRYFEHTTKGVVDTFSFPKKVSAKNKSLLEEIKKSESVSVHVRRGDYADNKEINQIYGLVPTSYYRATAKLIKEFLVDPRFYIFSDDIAWCQKNIRLGENVIYISHNSGSQNYEDMRLMSACKHNIISNSSFSWWGAWLNQNTNKRIYAPSRWVRRESLSNNDLIPKSWIQL